MAILRKIKSGVKKMIARGKSAAAVKRAAPAAKKIASKKPPAAPARSSRRAVVKQAVSSQEKEILGVSETAVGKMKFSTPEALSSSLRSMPTELPCSYGKDKLVIHPRDPHWIYSYWEVIPGTYDSLRGRLGEDFYKAKKILRIYDVSNIVFNSRNAHKYFDIEVGPDALSWYIHVQEAGRSWCVDLGLRLPNGEFITILRSNVISTPLDGPSWITDEEWMVPEELFARLYGMGFGFGQSSPIGKTWQERIKRELFSGILSSPGLSSAGSPVKSREKNKGRKFWMVVNTELILYGATEPDAKVTVQGVPVKLRPDGSFSLRFALPDGTQVMPVRGVSADGEEERTITPIVSRETK
ncbi:MAG: DUF4912 domain-containing protein [Candidatus Omnitrophota bacterium]|jgi:hypothetical protein